MRGQTNLSILRPKLQRNLRSNATDTERKIWPFLRNQQLAGCKFRRQHPYHDFILDFVCLERKLVVEIDGGQHLESLADADRDEFLQSGGFCVLRFWNHEVMNHVEEVAEMILQNLITLASPSPPNPPLDGED